VPPATVIRWIVFGIDIGTYSLQNINITDTKHTKLNRVNLNNFCYSSPMRTFPENHFPSPLPWIIARKILVLHVVEKQRTSLRLESRIQSWQGWSHTHLLWWLHYSQCSSPSQNYITTLYYLRPHSWAPKFLRPSSTFQNCNNRCLIIRS
jgi:hypothetical protein